MPFDIPSAITAVMGVVTKFIPDRTQQIAIEAQITQQINTIAAQQSQAQTDIDKVEASSENWFVSCWRPFIGWIGGLGLGWHFVVYPIASAILVAFNNKTILPDINSPDLMNLVYALLGVGTMRTVERVMGLAPTASKK
jgi:hypothetical protein